MTASDEFLSCTVCGCTSTWKAAFRPVKDGTLTRLCCPRCAAGLVRKHNRIGVWVWAAALVLWIPRLFGGERVGAGSIFEVLVPAWLLYAASFYMLIVLHELGHALVANLVGAPAYGIHIGQQPWLIDRPIGRIRWRIGRHWRGGMTFHAPCEGRAATLRSVLITIAGPLTNIVVAFVALTLAGRGSLSGSPGWLALFILGIASATLAVLSLWPRRMKTPFGEMRSDGANILRRLRGEKSNVPLERAYMRFYRAHAAFDDGEFVAAASEAATALESGDDDTLRSYLLLLRAAALAQSDDAPGAVALLLPMLESAAVDDGIRASVMDNLAWAYLLVDEREKLEQGLELVAQACALAPWETSFLICRICLMAASANPENGRAHAAQAMLAQLGQEKMTGPNAAYASLARGLIAAAHGDASARREYENAKSLHATAAPLRVLERRLPSR